MPTGQPKAGFRRTKGYWAKVADTQSAQGIDQDLRNDAPRLVDELKKLTKPIECPHCGNKIHVIDKDVAMYLVDHAIGKSKQRLEMDVTETLRLTADQADIIIEKHLPGLAKLISERYHVDIPLLPEGDTIEGDYKEV